jgi:uncharacterized protein
LVALIEENMTPEENVKIAQKTYADFLRGDVAGVLGALDENIEWKTPELSEMPSTGTLRGRDQVAGFFKSVAETWDFQSFDPREYISSGDQVIVRGSYRPRSRKTGSTISVEWVMAWRFRDGKITHFQEYTDSAALRDALTAKATA